MNKCETCRFWKIPNHSRTVDLEHKISDCRKRVPQVFGINSDGELIDGFPTTREHDWCGEHQPREEEEEG